MSRYLTRPNFLLAAIMLVAAFFRLFRLDQIPPGFQFDQAFYVFDALKLLQGDFSIFFFQPGRSEPLYQYLLMVGVALFGADTPLGLKLTGVAIGLLSIPLVYGFTRTLFSRSLAQGGMVASSGLGEGGPSLNSNMPATSREGVRVALLAAFFTAISFWQIFYSRYGERNPLTAFMAILVFWFLWRALAPSQPSGVGDRGTPKWRYYVLTGLFTGVTLYTYPGGRVVPIAVLVLIAYAILTDRGHALGYLKGLFLAGVIAAVVFMPLGIYYLAHPLDFYSHSAEVSIFVPHGAVTADIPLELGKNALRILGMFFVVGDGGALRNLPYRPIFDPLVGALFCVGAIVWLRELVSRKPTHTQRLRAMFLLVWLGLAVGLSLVSDDAPNNARVLVGFPVVMILPAWGASAIWERLGGPLAQRAAAAAIGIVIVTSAVLVYRDYFIVLANDPGTYYAFDTDKVETANWINQNAPLTQLYLAPLTSQIGTVSLLTHLAPVKTFESRDTVVLPSNAGGTDALFAFPWEQEKKVQTMAERVGALGARAEVVGSNGGKLLLILRVPAINLPDSSDPLGVLAGGSAFLKPQRTTRAVWNNKFELLGYSTEAGDPAKRNLEVTLFFYALNQIVEDYTFSVKVHDAKNRTWGQEDKWLGDNSYATSTWSPGDLIVEKFYPGLNACAPASVYTITVEAYDPMTSQVLGLSNRDGNVVVIGSTNSDASPSNRPEDLEPDQALDVQVSDRLHLTGYTLTPEQAAAGQAFSLSLFWRGAGQGSSEPVAVHLQDAAKRDVTLAQGTVKIPIDGRGLCTFYDFTMPDNVQSGPATLWVNNSKVAGMNVK
jgi:hypothetical protein